ncbi:unnamed protein product [Lathyrus oleraceus]
MIVFARAAKKKESYMLFSIHSVAAFAATRVADAAVDAPAVAVPRLLDLQDTYAKFMFHCVFACMK